MADNLTVAAVTNAKPRVVILKGAPVAVRTEILDGHVPGLFLIVQPSGTKSWALRYAFKGRNYKMTLGSADVFSLAEARDLARDAHKTRKQGKNPVDAKREKEEAAEAARQEFEQRKADNERAAKLADDDLFESRYTEYERGYIKKPGNLRPATVVEVERIFKKHGTPAFKGLHVSGIKTSKIEKLIADVAKENGPAAANKLFAWLKHFFGFFEAKRDDEGNPILARSPMVGMEKPAAENQRERVLTDDEVRWFWKACDDDARREFEVTTGKKRVALESTFGAMLQLTLLNLVRRDEMRCARFPEFDLAKGHWIIPGSRTKNGRSHLIPLASASVDILCNLPRVEGTEKFVFSTNGRSAMSGLAKGKKRIADAMLRIAREEATKRGDDPAKVEIPQWQIHDLRRTGITTMARLGVPMEIRKRCANQTGSDKLDKSYNHWDFEPEKRAAFAKWADFVLATVKQKPGKLILFNRGAA